MKLWQGLAIIAAGTYALIGNVSETFFFMGMAILFEMRRGK